MKRLAGWGTAIAPFASAGRSITAKRLGSAPLTNIRLLLVSTLIGLPSAAAGEVIVFDSKSEFLAATGATSATGPLPLVPGQPATITVGAITFQGPTMQMREWSARLPGNELAIDGIENFNVILNLTSPVFALGFDFVEPESDPFVNAPFVDSTFEVSLFNGAQPVDSFTFNAPNDVAAFVGGWGAASFDRVEIREIIGANENEFFGEFFTGTTAIGTVAVGQVDWSTVKRQFRPQQE
ncbi:MAG: hypothetical protein ACE5G2_08610 [Candidatus Krumholzibacteriia bacterium]